MQHGTELTTNGTFVSNKTKWLKLEMFISTSATCAAVSLLSKSTNVIKLRALAVERGPPIHTVGYKK